MARCSFAEWRPLPGSEPAITATQFIFHTMVGWLPTTDSFFRSGASQGIEAHFGLGGPWGAHEDTSWDGRLWQWRDTSVQADANFRANVRAISVETSDGGDPARPWTPRQLAMLVRLGNWAADHHGIPRRVCPAWDAPGFGWHAMWGAPSNWTPAAGKTCPGPVRIRQLREVVLPAIFAGRQLEEDDLPYTEAQLKEIAYQGALDGHRRAAGGSRDAEVSAWYARLERKVDVAVQAASAPISDAQLEVLAQRLAPLVAAQLEGAAHPTLEITGVAVPKAP